MLLLRLPLDASRVWGGGSDCVGVRKGAHRLGRELFVEMDRYAIAFSDCYLGLRAESRKAEVTRWGLFLRREVPPLHFHGLSLKSPWFHFLL